MRNVHPFEAFLMNFIGCGFMYVGQFGLGVALVAGLFLGHAILGWSGLVFRPVGMYLLLALIVSFCLLLWVLPPFIAWRRKEVASRPYNRWYYYVAWLFILQVGAQFWVLYNGQIGGYEIYRIPNRAMEPTLQPGDWIVADTWRYKSESPEVGDIVIYSADEYTFLSRVVGVPGDTIEIRDGTLYRNGAAVEEPYLHEALTDRPYGRAVPPRPLRYGQYYLLGDFRDNSSDSRKRGPVARSRMISHAEMIGFAQVGWRIGWDRFPRRLAEET